MRKLAIVLAAVLAAGTFTSAAFAQDDDAPALGRRHHSAVGRVNEATRSL